MPMRNCPQQRPLASYVVWPVEGLDPSVVAKPVADEILVARVEQNANAAGELVRDHVLKLVHPIAAELKRQRDDMVAAGPLVCANTQHRTGGR